MQFVSAGGETSVNAVRHECAVHATDAAAVRNGSTFEFYSIVTIDADVARLLKSWHRAVSGR